MRLAVRSQLGFTSLRLPSAGRRSNLWRSLFNFSRSRHSGSLALVSADLEDGNGAASSASELLSPDSDDTDMESERDRERGGVGAVGGPVTALPQKTLPASSVQAAESSTTSATPANALPSLSRVQNGPGEAVPTAGLVTVETADLGVECHGNPSQLPTPPASALRRLTRNLHRFARNLMTPGLVQPNQTWTSHSPLRQLDTGRGGTESTERRRSGDEDEDVELLIPDSDSSPSFGDLRQPLLDPQPSRPSRPSSAAAQKMRRQGVSGTRAGWDGPCEHCGKVHTAQVPDTCLEVASKMESSDDELLQLC